MSDISSLSKKVDKLENTLSKLVKILSEDIFPIIISKCDKCGRKGTIPSTYLYDIIAKTGYREDCVCTEKIKRIKELLNEEKIIN